MVMATLFLRIIFKFRNGGIARIFQGEGGGGGLTLCQPRVLTRLACLHPGHVLLNVTFFFRMSSECGWKDKPTN